MSLKTKFKENDTVIAKIDSNLDDHPFLTIPKGTILKIRGCDIRKEGPGLTSEVIYFQGLGAHSFYYYPASAFELFDQFNYNLNALMEVL